MFSGSRVLFADRTSAALPCAQPRANPLPETLRRARCRRRLRRRGGRLGRRQLDERAGPAAVFGGESRGVFAARERDDAWRATVELHCHRLPIRVQHVFGLDTRNDIAPLDGEGVPRAQSPPTGIIGDSVEPDGHVPLGSIAQRAGCATVHQAFAPDPGHGPHVRVNRAPASLTDRGARGARQAPTGVPKAQRQREHDHDSGDSLCAIHPSSLPLFSLHPAPARGGGKPLQTNRRRFDLSTTNARPAACNPLIRNGIFLEDFGPVTDCFQLTPKAFGVTLQMVPRGSLDSKPGGR